MQTIENDYAVVTLPATAADETTQNNYESVRYKAMKHGILSRLKIQTFGAAGGTSGRTSTDWSQWELTERIAVTLEEQIKANRENDLDEIKL